MPLYYLSDVVTVLSLDAHTNTDRPFMFAVNYLLQPKGFSRPDGPWV